MRKAKTNGEQVWLVGIEGGGTCTRVVVAEGAGLAWRQFQLGPSNLRLLSDGQLLRQLRAIRLQAPRPAAVGIGLAGARTEGDRERIRRAAARVWPGVPCAATNDLETALLAATAAGRDRSTRRQPAARVLVLSGTGSCCFGQSQDGRAVKVGGWGHLLGDKGSGYEVGLRALQAVVQHYDREGVWPALGEELLRALLLNEPEDLVGWVQGASKAEIGALARVVFAAGPGDKTAAGILDRAARRLADDAVACARRLVKPRAAVDFVLAGGVLLGQPGFARKVARLLRLSWPGARVEPLRTEGAWGAVELARRVWAAAQVTRPDPRPGSRTPARPAATELQTTPAPSLEQLADSPTEQRNPRSMNLDRLSLEDAVTLMLREDARIPGALRRERAKIVRAIGWIARALGRGGRLFYVGAGTSGRLGVLDASECPPTFQTEPDLVQGIMAGGQRALWESVEGAEDDAGGGAQAVAFRGVNRKDVVVGIAASGRTPFVWGALGEAARRGASTVLLCFNPSLQVPRSMRPDLCIAPRIGPEILTGSTRLKAGTATKLVLNMFTTLAMVRLGKVMSNLMIDVHASNAKLRDRAVRIVGSLTGATAARARLALEESNWAVREAVRRLQLGRASRREAPGLGR